METPPFLSTIRSFLLTFSGWFMVRTVLIIMPFLAVGLAISVCVSLWSDLSSLGQASVNRTIERYESLAHQQADIEQKFAQALDGIVSYGAFLQFYADASRSETAAFSPQWVTQQVEEFLTQTFNGEAGFKNLSIVSSAKDGASNQVVVVTSTITVETQSDVALFSALERLHRPLEGLIVDGFEIFPDKDRKTLKIRLDFRTISLRA